MSWTFDSNHSVSPDVPLDDVSVVVAGDELRVERVPQQRRHFWTLLGDGQVHGGILCWREK